MTTDAQKRTMGFLTPTPIPLTRNSACRTCGRARAQRQTLRQMLVRKPRLRMSVYPENSTASDHTPDDVPEDNGGNQAYKETEGPVTFEAEVREPSISELKCDLFAATAACNRGLLVTSNSRPRIDGIIEQLERANPSPNSAEDRDLFMGNWRLLYTNAVDILSLGLLSPVALVNQVYQNIFEASDNSASDFGVENVIELEPTFATISNKFVGRTMAKVVVAAEAKKQSASVVDLTFKQVAFLPQTFIGMPFPEGVPLPKLPLGSPVGAIDTTFLDEDLRISRVTDESGFGGSKNVFVLVREEAL